MRRTTFLFSRFNILKRKPVVLFVVIACAVVCVVSVSAWRLSKAKDSSIANPQTQTSTEITSPPLQTRERLSAERITVKPSGIEPSEITRTSEAFLLIVDNKSGIENISFRLERVNTQAGTNETTGNSIVTVRNDIRVGNGRNKWHDKLNLQPGEYVLTATDRPEWSCRITVTQ